ncbi:DUF4374 domain-containing protein [Sphingobacterium phlebotomi]|uniref:DUF4374 domain-containing protein n=1 Tax=Sphingobacterium phlebotomi TaxID=2605433 RepID=A0A5D4H8J3_9SPHI|nr:DUF4374 domain-containing protein [Sphingobacterium phlebotomi]TYR36874.1 DUF4374 domain-containing protein [Sphingobacterium phlebotomi]
MKAIKQYTKTALACALLFSAAACTKDDNSGPDEGTGPIIEGNETFVLGVGITDAENNSTNYIVHTKDLLSGKISLLNNGILQEGYREYFNIGNYFYAIGGLGVNNVDAYYIASDSRLKAKTGLVFQNGSDGYISVNNDKTLLGVNLATDDSFNGNVEFTTVDVASYPASKVITVPAKDVYKPADDSHGWKNSGIVVRGNQAFQTIFPMGADWATPKVDEVLVAVYSYPDFQFQKLITDPRTGPAGATLTRSGIFLTESGDMYTLFHAGYGFDHKTTLKDPAILKIKAGTDEFDEDYYFKTTGIPNGGKLIKATYVGNNKLLGQIYTKETTDQWDQTDLKYVIVDLVEQTITAVQNSPVYTYSEEAFVVGDKAYLPAKVGASLNVYEVDIPTATAKKGVEIEATYIKGIGKLTK